MFRIKVIVGNRIFKIVYDVNMLSSDGAGHAYSGLDRDFKK